MRGSRVLAVAVVSMGACRGGSNPPPPDGAPQDPYSISIAAPDVIANELMPVTVSITGLPGDDIVIDLDRSTAGTLDPSELTLDAQGKGSARYTPCTDVYSGCVGPATLRSALASSPTGYVATELISVDATPDIGEGAPCMTHDNVFYLHSAHGEVQTAPTDSWTVMPLPDDIELDAAGGLPTGYRGTFSLVSVPEPLAPGVYEQVERAGFTDPGHPGLEVIGPSVGGCNMIGGRFKIHDYTADPVLGTVYSVTISFEQLCDGALAMGCVHYETPRPNPIICPAIDPAKVSVQARSAAADGTPDPSAIAIFTDAAGTVVADTMVDICGQAQASLPSGGSLTTIQTLGSYELVNTYRGLSPGDHVVVYPGAPTNGASDMMLASFVPPTNANNVSLMTACGGGGWSKGGGPVDAYLTFRDTCRTPTFDMLSIASFPDVEPHQFAWQTGLTHLANGNVSVPMSWAPMGSATVTFANVPASSPAIGATWSTKIDAAAVAMGTATINAPIAGNQSVSVSYPPGAGDGAVVDVGIGGGIGLLSFEQRKVVETGAPSAITVDFATQPIPLVSAMQQTTNGGSWTETAGGTADVRTLIWRAQLHTGVRVIWTLVEPYDGKAVSTLPTLPAGHASQDPTVDAGAQLFGAAVLYVDYDTVAGFTLLPPTGSYKSHSSGGQTFNFQFEF
jgi:hypothetical protein